VHIWVLWSLGLVTTTDTTLTLTAINTINEEEDDSIRDSTEAVIQRSIEGRNSKRRPTHTKNMDVAGRQRRRKRRDFDC
jgi:hypothetical protein